MIYYNDLDGDKMEVTDLEKAIKQAKLFYKLELRENDATNRIKLYWSHTLIQLLKMKFPNHTIYLYQLKAKGDNRHWEYITPIIRAMPDRLTATILARRTANLYKGEIRLTVDNYTNSGTYFKTNY